MKSRIFIALALLLIFYVWFSRDKQEIEEAAPPPGDLSQNVERKSATPLKVEPIAKAPPQVLQQKKPTPTREPEQKQPRQKPSEPNLATKANPEPPEHPGSIAFVVEDGLAVAQGDIVLGLAPESGVTQGRALEPTVRLWPMVEIPYHIQPYLPHPERVEETLAMFDETVIRFVPYQGHEEDVLVFEEGTGSCKSYVGYIGGHQPIWLSPGCTTAEIAHEILHALGFVHEQNRSDRDQYIEVLHENVKENHQVNFEKFSPEMMRVSGLGPFDFNSIMIYPPSMFARGGQDTMRSRIDYQRIQPGTELSEVDIDRINQAYGGGR